LPEVAGDAAMLVDPTDVDALAAGVLRVVSDDALKARMSEAGLQRSRQFTWTKAAEQTLAAYRLAAER
jgi:glycosyltransferase involved in cell wall biosynthesis